MIFKWQEQPWKAWTRLRERLPHAILIQSGEGLGEFEFAKACAQSLLCERPQPDQRACGTCHACNWFSLGNHPDFRLIVPESMADRKSTRLNSSHSSISYAVFCLKKKKI